MKNLKDLNWLSAPAFFLILGIIALNAKNKPHQKSRPEKIKMESAALSVPRQPSY